MIKVALVGRPNVGKSTLFNRLCETRQALENNTPGTTRDRNRARFYWNKTEIEIIDTPGLNITAEKKLSEIEKNVQKQAKKALKEANLILYLIDFKTGPVNIDYQIIKRLRRQVRQQLALVVNKADKPSDALESYQYQNLGMGKPLAVSAKNGQGTTELLDLIAKKAKKTKSKTSQKTRNKIDICLLGRPNVGKSSFFNALLTKEEVTVSAVPHTTRDLNQTNLSYQNYQINLIDTAGLRKKARVYKSSKVEIFSVKKTLSALKKSQIALLLIDISKKITSQDLKIGRLIKKNNSALIIIANKWDKVTNKTCSLKQARQAIYSSFKFLNFAPIIFTNVKKPNQSRVVGLEEKFLANQETKSNNFTNQIFDLIISVYSNYNIQIESTELIKILNNAIKKQPPPKSKKTKNIKIINLAQNKTAPPEFKLQIKGHGKLANHYKQYLLNQIRIQNPLWGIPIKIKVHYL